MRNTFVGTPCWMAPEVMEQLHGYDFKADIWSFGITALELAHGHAPFSEYPPLKVLLKTLQNAPPGLDYERDKKFSKSFKQMIASCLVKDPLKRPSARKLIKHSFFKQGRSNDYIVRTLLDGLPSLGDRIKALKKKEEDMLAQKKMPDGKKEELSQNEYKRGISGWNFNLEDVKTQANMIQDDEQYEKDNIVGAEGSTSCSIQASDEEIELASNASMATSSFDSSGKSYNATNNLDCFEETMSEPTPKTSKTSPVNSEDLEGKIPQIQQKGRFKVTSENVDMEKATPTHSSLQKSQSLQVIAPIAMTSQSSPTGYQTFTHSTKSMFSMLHSFLQTNITQRDCILDMMKHIASGNFSVNYTSEGDCASTSVKTIEKSLLESAHEKEKELLQEIITLQWRLINTKEELKKLKVGSFHVTH